MDRPQTIAIKIEKSQELLESKTNTIEIKTFITQHAKSKRPFGLRLAHGLIVFIWQQALLY